MLDSSGEVLERMGIVSYPYALIPRLSKDQLLVMRWLREQWGPKAAVALQRWGGRYGPASQRPAQDGDEVTTPDTVRAAIHVRWASCSMVETTEVSEPLAAGLMKLGLCSAAGGRGTIILEARLCAVLLGLVLGTAPVPRSSTISPGEEGLISYALAELFCDLGPDFSWTLSEKLYFPPPNQRSLLLGAQVVIGDSGGIAWLLLDPDSCHRRSCSAGHAPAWRPRRLAGLLLELPVEIARFVLPRSELPLLQAGDILLSSHCPPPQPTLTSLLRVGRGGYAAQTTRSETQITGPFQRGGMGMPAQEEKSSGLTDELPVEIVLELGRVRLTGAQLMELEPGDVLALQRPLIGSIDIRVGDHLIGRGELVDVDGEAGVRLVQVYEQDGLEQPTA